MPAIGNPFEPMAIESDLCEGTASVSPWLPAALSLVVPGLGQAFNGQRIRGLFFLATCCFGIPWLLAPVDAYIESRKVRLSFLQRVKSAAIFAGVGAVMVILALVAMLPR